VLLYLSFKSARKPVSFWSLYLFKYSAYYIIVLLLLIYLDRIV